MLQRNARKNYQNLPEEGKHKKQGYPCNLYRNLFIENEFSEDEKNKKRQYARNLHNNLSKE